MRQVCMARRGGSTGRRASMIVSNIFKNLFYRGTLAHLISIPSVQAGVKEGGFAQGQNSMFFL
jgi:hypothetical protein